MIERVHATDKDTTQVILGMKNEIERLRAERDRLATTVEELLLSNNRWQSIAERAMEQLDIAMNIINTLQGVNNG